MASIVSLFHTTILVCFVLFLVFFSGLGFICSNSCQLSQWCYSIISSSVTLFPFCLQSFPESESFLMSWLFPSSGQSIGMSASASVLPMNIQDWFPLKLTGWSPCCPRDSQESSPAPQLETINSWALSLFYSPGLTSIHDSWRNRSFDYTDLCWQSDVSAFEYTV